LETFACPQAPAALHVSVVQALPSSQLTQAAPLAPHFVAVSEASAVQVPVAFVLQPEVQHAPLSQRPVPQAVPFATVVPVQTELPHKSFDVHRLPSSHPVVALGCWQAPPTHWSLVHGLPSSHVDDVPQLAHLFDELQKAVMHWVAVAAVQPEPTAFLAVQTPVPVLQYVPAAAQLLSTVHAAHRPFAQYPEVQAALVAHAAPFAVSALET
jgi:hypothetical protein